MTWTSWDDVAVQIEVVKTAADKLGEAWGIEQKEDGSWGPIRTPRTRLDKILRRNRNLCYHRPVEEWRRVMKTAGKVFLGVFTALFAIDVVGIVATVYDPSLFSAVVWPLNLAVAIYFIRKILTDPVWRI